MLWVAGGVGTTPFMAMWEGINNVAKVLPEQMSSDIVLIFSGRDDEINILKNFMAYSGSLPKDLNIRILAFQSIGKNSPMAQVALHALTSEYPNSELKVEQKRIQVSDLEKVEDLSNRDVFLCEPDALMS